MDNDHDDTDMTNEEFEAAFDDDLDEMDIAPIIRAKWTMDGATTLAEAAARVRSFADELDGLAASGWELREPVTDDYGFLISDTQRVLLAFYKNLSDEMRRGGNVPVVVRPGVVCTTLCKMADADKSVRESVERLLQSEGLDVAGARWEVGRLLQSTSPWVPA